MWKKWRRRPLFQQFPLQLPSFFSMEAGWNSYNAWEALMWKVVLIRLCAGRERRARVWRSRRNLSCQRKDTKCGTKGKTFRCIGGSIFNNVFVLHLRSNAQRKEEGKKVIAWFMLVDNYMPIEAWDSMVFNLQRALSIAEVVISMTPTLPNATLRLATSSSWSHLTFSCNLEVFIWNSVIWYFFQCSKDPNVEIATDKLPWNRPQARYAMAASLSLGPQELAQRGLCCR